MQVTQETIWEAAKKDYLSGNQTLCEIADKHELSRSMIFKKSANEGWAKEKRASKKRGSRASEIEDFVITLVQECIEGIDIERLFISQMLKAVKEDGE